MTRRVAITGLGTVNPLASDLKEFWRALCAGRNGISRIEQIDTTAFKVKFGGEVKNFNPEPTLEAKVARRLDRFAQFALVAAIAAVKDSGLDFSKEDPYRAGVIVGSGIGGLNEFEEQHARYIHGGPSKVSPFVIPKMIPNAAPGNISIHFDCLCLGRQRAGRCFPHHSVEPCRYHDFRGFGGCNYQHGAWRFYLRPRPFPPQ
jgi:3-oxoacyl-[acyl-carrier-protein] synthase II